MPNGDHQPTIVAFCCTWCTYLAADLAGTSRMTYAPNVRLIRVMCSGRVDPQFVLSAFRWGADGVLIGGCHIGDCHYLRGNFMTIKRMRFLQDLLKFTGCEPGRLHLEWISAAEGPKFAETVRNFTEKIKNLGPSRLKLAARAA